MEQHKATQCYPMLKTAPKRDAWVQCLQTTACCEGILYIQKHKAQSLKNSLLNICKLSLQKSTG